MAVSVPLALSAGSMRAGGLALGALAGIGGVLALALAGRGALVKGLFLGLLTVVYVPLDKYFAYRDHVGGWPGLRVSAADLPLALLVVLLAIGLVSGRLRNRVPPWLLIAYLLLLVQYALSMIGAARPDLSRLEIVGALHALLLAWVVAAVFRTEYLRPALYILAFMVVVHSAFGILQSVTERPIGASWLGGPDVLLREELLTGTVRVRPAGLFTHPVVYATFFVLALPVLGAALVSARRGLEAVLLAGALLLGLTGLGLTLSRGAWISAAFAGFCLTVLGWRAGLIGRRALRRLAVAGLVVSAVAASFAPLAWERMTASQEGNLDVRFELNEIAVRMISSKPVFGVGVSNFLPVMERYDPEGVAEYFPATVHNLYLLEASEAGLPALALLLLIFAVVVRTGLRAVRSDAPPRQRWVTLGLTAAFLGFALTQVADFSHRLEPLRSILWTHLGVLFALAASTSAASRRSPTPPREVAP